jgi:hypothetical protein
MEVTDVYGGYMEGIWKMRTLWRYMDVVEVMEGYGR